MAYKPKSKRNIIVNKDDDEMIANYLSNIVDCKFIISECNTYPNHIEVYTCFKGDGYNHHNQMVVISITHGFYDSVSITFIGAEGGPITRKIDSAINIIYQLLDEIHKEQVNDNRFDEFVIEFITKYKLELMSRW